MSTPGFKTKLKNLKFLLLRLFSFHFQVYYQQQDPFDLIFYKVSNYFLITLLILHHDNFKSFARTILNLNLVRIYPKQYNFVVVETISFYLCCSFLPFTLSDFYRSNLSNKFILKTWWDLINSLGLCESFLDFVKLLLCLGLWIQCHLEAESNQDLQYKLQTVKNINEVVSFVCDLLFFNNECVCWNSCWHA